MPLFFISFSMISCSLREGGHDRKKSKKLVARLFGVQKSDGSAIRKSKTRVVSGLRACAAVGNTVEKARESSVARQ